MSDLMLMLFAPQVTDVARHSSGSIVAKLAPDSTGVDLFFIEHHSVPGVSPEEQIVRFVTKLLEGAGFDHFEFTQGCEGCGLPTEVITSHPALEPSLSTF